MTCDETCERLPWLLNGSLAASEANAVDEHLAGCAACREELERTRLVARLFATHPSSADLVAHAFGDLGPDDAEVVAGHVAGCDTCAAELALVAASRDEMGRGESRGEGPARRAAQPSWLALAASVAVALLAGGGWLWTWQRLDLAGDGARRREAALAAKVERLERAARQPEATVAAPVATPVAAPPEGGAAGGERIATLERELAALRQPQLGLPMVELLPADLVVRGAGGEPAVVPAGSAATLLLVAEGIAAGGRYRVRVGAPGATPVWQGTGRAVASGEITLYLPAGALPPGSYEVRVAGPGGEGVGEYRVVVR